MSSLYDYESVEKYLTAILDEKIAKRKQQFIDSFKHGWLKILPLYFYEKAEASDDFDPLAEMPTCETLDDAEYLGEVTAKQYSELLHSGAA